MNKPKVTAKEEALLQEIYNLILDPNIQEAERQPLLDFKNKVEEGRDFKRETINLAESLRLLALKKVEERESLTPVVGQFYQKIMMTGRWDANLARGLLMINPSGPN